MHDKPVDPYAAVAAVLSRMQLAVEVHRPRLLRVLAPPADGGGVRDKAAVDQRIAAVSPATAMPPTRDELDELCLYFGISIDADTAGGHAVLREARRVLDQVATSPLAAGLANLSEGDALPPAGPVADAAGAAQPSPPGCHLRRWHWLAAVTLVPSVPGWQQAQQARLGKAELTSSPMNAAMLVASSTSHVVREAGVVAAAAAEERGGSGRSTLPTGAGAAPLSEAALAACHLLRSSLAFEQRCQLFQSLNVLRSVQRTLALRAGEHLSRPLPARGALHGEAPAGRPTAGRSTARASFSAAPGSESEVGGSAETTGLATAAATDGTAAPQAPLAETAAADGADSLAASLASATSPTLPPVRPVPGRLPHGTRRHLIEGGHEWYSSASDAPIESAAAPPGVPADPTRSTFVRDSSGRRVVHQAALADLAALTEELGRIVAHYGNDSAVAAVYGTGRYDNKMISEGSLQGVEAEAEVSKRLAVATALPATLRLVSRCIACEATYQRAKASLLLNLLHAYETCDDAHVAQDLAQQMTDLMAARPRLDLRAPDFEEGYRASTLALHLHETLLVRLLATHVDAAIAAAAAGAGASIGRTSGDDTRGAAAALGEADLVQRSPAKRRGMAVGCATVALALSRELATMEARTLTAAQKAHYGIGAASGGIPPLSFSRLRCLLLSHGLALSESLCAPPPLEAATDVQHDEPAAAAAAAVASQARLGADSECTPWVESGAVAAASEARAFSGSTGGTSGAGGAGAESFVPPLTAAELRARPGLIPTLGVWASVQRVSNELVELREALRRARPRMAWVPWITLLPRLTTSSAGLDAPSASRSLVPGTARLQKAEASLATAKRFLAAVTRDGASAAHASSSLGAARCVLQLLEAEKQALILLLTRQRPPTFAPPFPQPAVGGNAEDAAVADSARASMATLTQEAEDACRNLETLMRRHPPPFLAPPQAEECAAHEMLLLHAERALSAALADATAHREQLDAQAAVVVLADGGAARESESALRSAVTSAQASLHASEIVSREALDRDVRLLCADLETEIGEVTAKLAEIRSMDMSEAKKQALKQAQAPNAVAWDAAEKALQPSMPTTSSPGTTTVGVGGAVADDVSRADKAAARHSEVKGEREKQLGQLRALLALRSTWQRLDPALRPHPRPARPYLAPPPVRPPLVRRRSARASRRAQRVGERVRSQTESRGSAQWCHQRHCQRCRGWRLGPEGEAARQGPEAALE